jgi:hypothetical protein
MYKFLIIAVMFLFVGCSNVTFNAQMCDKIASDPKATIPQECIPYIEEEAAKASVEESEKITPKESIEFTKDK